MFSDREGIHKSFYLDGLTYVVGYRNHAFYLYVDFAESADQRALLPADFGLFDFYEPFPERVYEVQRPVKDPFRVKREVLAFMDPILRKVRPHFFDFESLDARRMSLYGRVADRLAAKYGYWLEQNGKSFRFYRMESQAA